MRVGVGGGRGGILCGGGPPGEWMGEEVVEEVAEAGLDGGN